VPTGDMALHMLIPRDLSADTQNVMRQGFVGMPWSKQFYHYVITDR